MSHIHKTRNSFLRYLGLTVIVVFGVISTLGTGGGGGDGGDGGLTYKGNTDPAIITVNNAPTLVANVLFGGTSTTDIPIAASTSAPSSRSAGAIVAAGYLRTIIKHSLDGFYENNLIGSDIVAHFMVDEPIFCDSGSGHISGQINDSTATGTLTFIYNNCMLDGVTYDGSGTFRVDYFDFGYMFPTDITMNFTRMTMSSAEFNTDLSGSFRMETMFGTNTVRMTLDYVSKDNLTEKMYKFEDFMITSVFDDINFPATMSTTFTGSPARVYDSIHGYVDVDTTSPLIHSSVDLPYPDSDGVMLFYGAGSTSIRLTVMSASHVQLELDIDDMAGYEILNYLLWEELGVNAGTDLTDTDGDGMHDMWETTYGLDPTLDDSALDLDSDTFSNLTEYQSGTNPNDAVSHP